MAEFERQQLSQSDQDHLRAIYKAGGARGRISMGVVAERLRHAPATVTAAAKRLQGLGLVDYRRYRGVELTPAGERVALEMVRHHRLVERFLVEFLGYDWDGVDEEADRLEHAISEELERRIAERVSDPTTDPHGQRIPNESLDALPDDARPLTSLSPGARATVSWVSDRDREVLAYVAEIGLVPGATLDVRAQLPFDGPLVIAVGDHERHLSRRVTDSVYVLDADDPANR